MHQDNDGRDGDDEPEVDSGDLWWQTAEKMNENATEMKNVGYKWNGPLHEAVEAGLEDRPPT